MKRTTETKQASALRCAIYMRKSTDEGFEQEDNSLDAQREAGEAYVASRKAEGWVCLPDRCDDGGFTGANIERPGVQRLPADIDTGIHVRQVPQSLNPSTCEPLWLSPPYGLPGMRPFGCLC